MTYLLGHETEKEIFKKLIVQDKVLGSYIFCGREGIGKKLFAQYLAKALVCNDGKFFERCTCPHCSSIDACSHPDVKTVEGDPKLKIDQIREVTENAALSPLSAKKKVYIIDNAHSMTPEAANSFLKTLEEPSSDTHFFLITDSYDRLLETIRSRCIKMEFKHLTMDEILTILENSSPANPLNDAAAKIASGSAGYALSIVEKELEPDALNLDGMSADHLWKVLDGLKDKNDVRIFISMIYNDILDKYRESRKEIYSDFSNYLLEISRRLDYNVNLEIFKIFLHSKLTEVY